MTSFVEIDGSWRLLRTAMVRGAGFPASMLLDLGGPHEIDALARIARRNDFIEAITWQNREVIDSAVRPFLSHPERTNSNARRKHHLVASYAARYAVKNDTIGFFGPIGWAVLDREQPTRLDPRDGGLSRREVFLEHWAIDAIAGALSRELLPFLSPRLHPAVRLEGSELVYASGRRTTLPAPAAELLRACDGARPACAIADEDGFDLLEQLADAGVVIWAIEIPVGDPHPERALRSTLLALSPEAPAVDSLAALDELESARKAVADARDDPPALRAAIDRLERSFSAMSGQPATRRGGETYGARTIFYEDCVRNMECVLGRSVIDRIATPLELVLQSARWFTHRIAREYEGLARRAYEDLRRTSSGPISFQQFWSRLEPGGLENASQVVENVARELTDTWSAILIGGRGDRRIAIDSPSIRARVLQAFAADRPGWPSARIHSPDLMLAADGPEALERGELFAVLGELHVSMNTLLSLALLPHRPEELEREVEALRLAPALLPVPPKSLANRAMILGAPHQIPLETGDARSPLARDRVVRIADLVVEEHEGTIAVRTLDGARRFSIFAALDASLSHVAHSSFRILPLAERSPRVTIDALVVSRERWSFERKELAFVDEKTPAARLTMMRRFAEEHELPRFSFVKLSNEAKPFYVDLSSQVSVDVFAHRARSAERIVLSEMLPSFDQLWLSDPKGQRYTSEIRIVAVDPAESE